MFSFSCSIGCIPEINRQRDMSSRYSGFLLVDPSVFQLFTLHGFLSQHQGRGLIRKRRLVPDTFGTVPNDRTVLTDGDVVCDKLQRIALCFCLPPSSDSFAHVNNRRTKHAPVNRPLNGPVVSIFMVLARPEIFEIGHPSFISPFQSHNLLIAALFPMVMTTRPRKWRISALCMAVIRAA